MNWFNTNTPSGDFLIIDEDKSLNALPSVLKKKLILTSAYIGFTEGHLVEIRQLRQKESNSLANVS